MNKAYYGDLIELTVDTELCPQGTMLIVDSRISDMGSVDDDEDCVIVYLNNTDDFEDMVALSDDEYKIIEYNNKLHKINALEEYLSKSNELLLSKFKWGSEGSGEFSKFMRLVRELYDSNY